MFGEVHYNRAFYQTNPQPGHHYRQIAIVEFSMFHLRIREGDVLLTEPEWKTDNPDAEEYLHSTLQQAREDAEREVAESLAAGWIPYVPKPRTNRLYYSPCPNVPGHWILFDGPQRVPFKTQCLLCNPQRDAALWVQIKTEPLAGWVTDAERSQHWALEKPASEAVR